MVFLLELELVVQIPRLLHDYIALFSLFVKLLVLLLELRKLGVNGLSRLLTLSQLQVLSYRLFLHIFQCLLVLNNCSLTTA